MIKLFKTPSFIRWLVPRRTWGFSSSDTVYLTFDDGPTEALTETILDILNEKEVKATFFCVGANAKKHPQLMVKMINEGHVIGNHTMRHENGNRTSKQAYLDSIEEASEFIDSKLFRPPYGRLPITFVRSIKKDYDIIMWSWLSYDFDENVTVESILAKGKEQIKPGNILVLHDNAKVKEKIKVLLPQLIEDLKMRGLKFGVISV